MPGIARSGRLLDETSDFIDEGMCAVFLECSRYSCSLSYFLASVNVLKGQTNEDASSSSSSSSSTSEDWKSESHFDSEKDKSQFRRYEEACDRVKAFYKEQHGTFPKLTICVLLHRS